MAVRKPLVLIGGVRKELPTADSIAVGWAWLSGVPETASRWPTWTEVTSKPATFPPSAHTHAAADVTTGIFDVLRIPNLDTAKITTGTFANARIAVGNVTQHQAALSIGWGQLTAIPAFASRWPDWTEVTGKPTTFAPSAHTHPISDITNLQTSLDGKANLSGANFTGRVQAASGTASEVIGSSVGGRGQIEVLAGGSAGTAGAAFISYHRGGNFAAYMGLDTDNKWKVGGWSMGAVAYEIWHAGNDTALGAEASTVSTVVRRNSAGDINVRLLRSEFGNDTYINGAMAFRTNNTTDNYTRYCSDTAAIRTFLNVPALGAAANFAHLQSTSARIVVQGQTDGTNTRGIFLWTGTDSNWGIYMAQAGAGRSLSGGTACTSLSGRTAHHARFRAGSATTQGFIWENQLETCLMSLDGDTGRLRVAGNIDLNGAFLGAWPGASTYKGLIAADGSYLVMTGSGDPQTYVGAQPGRDIVLRPNGNDGNAEVKITSTGFNTTKPHFKLAANSASWVQQPRIFVQSADPGAAAADGDIWLW